MDKLMKHDYKKTLRFLLQHRLILSAGFLIFLVLSGTYLILFSGENLRSSSFTDESSVNSDSAGVSYNVYAKGDYLYKSSKTGEEAVKDFIKKNPTIDGKKILPDDFLKNSILTRRFTDPQDGNLAKQLKNKQSEHFYYTQKLNGLPIFSSNVSMHLKNNNQIYAVGGNITFNKKISEEKISEDQAKREALVYAKEHSGNIDLKVSDSQKMIFNKKIIGIADDDVNYPVLTFEISSDSLITPYKSVIFVNLTDGKVIYSNDFIHEALNRQVRTCNGSTDRNSCTTVIGTEGNPPPSSDTDASNVYQYFGDIYNYFKTSFGRDSYDNGGAQLRGSVHMGVNYKNAFWTGTEMFFGDDMVILDVTGHEVTHGITQRTAGLVYAWQSGAMNEAISDIFGSALDNNWTLGEGSALGVIRRMDNPLSSKTPQPDKLFSPKYYCVPAGSQCTSGSGGNDNCGVHRNSGVLNKAFYLMTDGGNFNGCSISGIGRTKAHAVIYRALTTYLTSSSNFSQAYSQILSACNDLYGSTSNECGQVKAALQATEMDQQPSGTQVGPSCSGIAPKTPACAGGATGGNPTSIPTGSTTGGGTSSTGGGTTGGGSANGKHVISGIVYLDANKNLSRDNNELGIANVPLVLEGPTSGNANTDPSGSFQFSDLSSGNYKLVVKAGSVSLLEYPNIDVTQNGVSYSVDVPIFPEMQKLLDELNSSSNIPTSPPNPTSGNSLTPSPTPITIYDCKQKTKTQLVAGKQIQISYLECKPTGTVQPKTTP